MLVLYQKATKVQMINNLSTWNNGNMYISPKKNFILNNVLNNPSNGEKSQNSLDCMGHSPSPATFVTQRCTKKLYLFHIKSVLSVNVQQ